jgi:hypothetical protein
MISPFPRQVERKTKSWRLEPAALYQFQLFPKVFAIP